MWPSPSRPPSSSPRSPAPRSRRRPSPAAARTPRWLRSFRRELAARDPARPLIGVRHGFRQFVEEAVELAGRVEIHRLGQVVLRPVVADLIPLAIAPLGLGSGGVAEDEAG